MNKIIKYICITILGLILGYIFFFFVAYRIFRHSVDWKIRNDYLWIFKDSSITDINKVGGVSYVGENDVHNSFIFKDNYYISVWEFKNIDSINLQQVSFNQKVNLDDITFWGAQVINKKSNEEIMIKFGFEMNNTLNINLDNHSNIKKKLINDCYKGFYGTAHKLSLSLGKNEHQVVFEYPNGPEPIVFLIYKTRKSFFIITVTSNKIPFDDRIINIFELQ